MSSLIRNDAEKSLFDFDAIMVVVSCVIGAFLMLWSASEWFSLMNGSQLGSSFCSINLYWNCDRASLSYWGAPLGIPIGLFGVVWFVMVGLLSMGSHRFLWPLRVLWVLGGAAGIGLAIYLFLILKTGCLVCLFTYLLILLAIFFGYRFSKKSGGLFSDTQIFLLIVMLLITHVGYSWAKVSSLQNQWSAEEVTSWVNSLEIKSVSLKSPLTLGKEDAPIQIVEFSDYQCPYCALSADRMSSIFDKRIADGTIRFTYIPFPLDSACNSQVKQGGHRGSCAWARATLCAQKQGRGWNVYAWVFAKTFHGEELPPVSESLATLKLDNEEMKSCLADPASEQELIELIDQSRSVQISSTPTFLVNGRVIKGFQPPLIWKKLISSLNSESK